MPARHRHDGGVSVRFVERCPGGSAPATAADDPDYGETDDERSHGGRLRHGGLYQGEIVEREIIAVRLGVEIGQRQIERARSTRIVIGCSRAGAGCGVRRLCTRAANARVDGAAHRANCGGAWMT